MFLSREQIATIQRIAAGYSSANKSFNQSIDQSTRGLKDMKISISIGTDAKTAFEAVIASGVVTGLELDNHTLTFDYSGLTANEALQRAVDNQKAIGAEAEKAEGDTNPFNYALGFMAVAVERLAAEQVVEIPADAVEIKDAPVENETLEASPNKRGKRTSDATNTAS